MRVLEGKEKGVYTGGGFFEGQARGLGEGSLSDLDGDGGAQGAGSGGIQQGAGGHGAVSSLGLLIFVACIEWRWERRSV